MSAIAAPESATTLAALKSIDQVAGLGVSAQVKDRAKALKDTRDRLHPKKTFREMAGLDPEGKVEKIPYNNDSNALRLRLNGAGALKREGNNIVEDPDASWEQGDAIRQTEAVVQKNAVVLSYLEILSAQNPAARFDELYINAGAPRAGRPEIGAATDFNTLRANTLNILAGDIHVQALFDETYVSTGANTGTAAGITAWKQFIDITLAGDPRFRVLLADKVGQVNKEANKALSKNLQDRDKLRQEKRTAKTSLDTQVTAVKDALRVVGINININIIREVMNRSESTDEALTKIKARMLLGHVAIRGNVTKENAVRSLTDLEIAIAKAEAFRAGLPAGDGRIIAANGEITAANAAITAFKGTATYMDGVNGIMAEDMLATGILVPLNPQVDAALISKKTIVDKDTSLAAIEDAANTDERSRLDNEEVLKKKLDKAIAEAAVELTEERADEHKATIDKLNEEQDQKSKDQKARNISLAMKSRYQTKHVDKNTRKENIKHIGEDMKLLIHDPDDGLKRIMAREYYGLDATGRIKLPTPPGPKAFGDFDVELDIPEQDRAAFTTAVNAKGEAYKQRLMVEFFRNRKSTLSIFGKEFGLGTTSLSRDDWEDFALNYSGEMDQALSKYKETQGVMARLKEQGITPGFKFKWMLWLMATLGMGVTTGGVGSIATAGLSLAGGLQAAGGAAVAGIAGRQAINQGGSVGADRPNVESY